MLSTTGRNRRKLALQTVLKGTWNKIMRMRNEDSSKWKHQNLLVCFFGYLYCYICEVTLAQQR
jgi:hypothetical protein